MKDINIQAGCAVPNPFKPGYKAGKLTVLKYIARSQQHLITGNWLSQPRNWYEAKCDCGAVEVISQPVLAPSGRRQCLECCAEDKARHISAARHQTVEALPVPDFARMKF